MAARFSADSVAMERRREPRFAMDQPVVVTVLDAREIRRGSQVVNASALGIGLEMRCPAEPGARVRIELGEAVLTGEVVHCREAAGAYYVGVRLNQALHSLADLALALEDPARQCRRESPIESPVAMP
jgi:hypothetical protein